MPKKPLSPMGPRPPRPSPEELARRVIARLEPAPGGRVRLAPLRLTLTRGAAEALSASAIARELNFEAIVEELLESGAAKLRKRAG